MKPPFFTNVLLLFISGSTGWAASTTYSDRGLFENAAGTLPGIKQVISFDPVPWRPNYSAEFGPVLTVSNVTFTGRYLIAFNHTQVTTSGTVLFNSEASSPLRIAFDYPVKAFGADYGSASASQFASFTATLTLDSGQTFSFESPTNPHSTFFGFILDQPILGLTFSDGGKFNGGFGFFFHGEMIKDIFMVREIPEPGGPLLVWLYGGLLLYQQVRRERRHR